MSDYNNGGQRPAPRPTHALNNKKLDIWAPNGQGKNATLKWGFVSNNPRLNVYTNVDNDRDNGRISANLDLPTFAIFLNLLNEAINFKPKEGMPEFKVKIENKRANFKPGAERGSKVTESELWVGKDTDGVVWLSVTAYQRPKIKFPFVLSDWHSLQHASGEGYTKAEASVLVARAYVKLLEHMIAIMAVNLWEEPKKKDAPNGGQGGSNGGGYNRGGQGNGGGGYNRNQGGGSGGGSAPSSAGGGGFSDDMDGSADDIPY